MKSRISRPQILCITLLLTLVFCIALCGAGRAAPANTGEPQITDPIGSAIEIRKDQTNGEWKTYILDDPVNYTGIAQNAYGTWYCIDGIVDFTFTGIVENDEDQYLVQDGAVALAYTGNYDSTFQTYTVQNGKVTETTLNDTVKGGLVFLAIAALVITVVLIKTHKKKVAPKPKETPQPTQPKKVTVKVKAASTSPVKTTVKVPVKVPAESAPESFTKLPYRRVNLLTPNEGRFYRSLKPIADELGYSVLAKIRMGDLVQPLPTLSWSEKSSYRGRVKSRHVDFALADPETLAIHLLIELDDWSHGTKKSQEIDEFKNNVYASAGYNLLRVYDDVGLKEKIEEMCL